MIMLVLFGVLLIVMFMGVSTIASMGIVAVGTFWFIHEGQNLAMLAQRMYVSTTGITLLAIPFFILAGNLMNTGGVTHRIFNFAKAMVGHWWGGLGHADVVACTIFAGMSGSAVAEAAGLGVVEINAMDKAGYGRRFPAAITGAAATIGPVIPPSIPFVIYASITGTSVGKLFMAGFLPGIMLAVALMIAVYFISRKRGYPREKKATFKELFIACKQAFLPLMTPVIIIGGILGGIFTPTEAAVVAALYAAILGFVVYKEIKIRDIPEILWETLVHSIKVLFIIAIAGFFSYLLMHQHIPQMAIAALTSLSSNPTILILIIIFIILVLGCFLEGVAIILITTPIFLPILNTIGYDLVQYGVVLVLACNIGLLTPPVGMNLYTVASISGEGIWDLTVEMAPYMLGMLIVTLIIALLPALTTTFPSLFSLGYDQILNGVRFI